jgi:DNA-binding MurR/RpiR family transcriptional regulator
MKPAADLIERAVSALLASPRVEDAAQHLGISRTTLWRMTREPEFQQRLREARLRLSEEIVVTLQANALDAVGTLREIMLDKESPAPSRVTAASKLIEYSLRAKDQLEMEQRVAALENALRQREGGKG